MGSCPDTDIDPVIIYYLWTILKTVQDNDHQIQCEDKKQILFFIPYYSLGV